MRRRALLIVNLQLGSATGVGGGIANIQNITGGGGPGYNIIVGNGGNVIRGGNGRKVNQAIGKLTDDRWEYLGVVPAPQGVFFAKMVFKRMKK